MSARASEIVILVEDGSVPTDKGGSVYRKVDSPAFGTPVEAAGYVKTLVGDERLAEGTYLIVKVAKTIKVAREVRVVAHEVPIQQNIEELAD